MEITLLHIDVTISTSEGVGVENMSILIIGNSETTVVQLHSFFNEIDITDIISATNVEEAIDTIPDFFKSNIDIIIFDVLFTQQTCEEICQQIQSLNNWLHVPIILSTNYDTRNTIEKAFEAGIFDFILKPLDFSHFKARIHIALKYREETKLRRHQESNLQKDLAIAKRVQKNALTPSLHLKNIQFDGVYVTSHTLGGDMYNWFKINEDLTAVILYDVMGHGVASSLISMSIRSLLRGMITKLIDPVLVMDELNRHIYGLFSDEDMDRFLVTAIYMVIDIKNRTLHYANASHPPELLLGQHGETVMLPSNTPILGLFPSIKINKKTVNIDDWNRVILYTDGLLKLSENETIDIPQFNSFTNKNNEQFLSEFSKNNHLSDNHYSDDITIISITITLKGRWYLVDFILNLIPNQQAICFVNQQWLLIQICIIFQIKENMLCSSRTSY